MPLEVELKLRVSGHGEIRARLRAVGAEFMRRELETNTFLDTRDSRLLHSGSGLRVRRAQDLDQQGERVVITHRGPRLPGPMKVRPETEAIVSSYDDAIDLLKQLGYEVTLSFEKRRETWELGDCEIVLDELPEDLGTYVEIEGEDQDHVLAIRDKLQLTTASVEPEGYAVLVARHLEPSRRKTITFQ